MTGTHAPPVIRFWRFVEPTEDCWLWTGATSGAGYGCFRSGSSDRYAHRFAYRTFVGPIPEGVHVLHHCDTPACVKPEHLFLGRDAENHADMVRKGRSTAGERNRHAKLTRPQIEEIRKLYNEGLKLREIAPMFGVTFSNIGYIVRGKTWR